MGWFSDLVVPVTEGYLWASAEGEGPDPHLLGDLSSVDVFLFRCVSFGCCSFVVQ